MKRLIFVLSAVTILSSCASAGNAAKPPELDVPFGAEAEISYGGSECTAKIVRYGSGSWEFTITEPYALEGLTVTESGGKTTLSMLGMESTADISGAAVSMARALSSAYDAAAAGGEVTHGSAGETALTGTSDIGRYRVTLGENAEPAVIASEDCKLKAQLSSFAVMPENEVTAELDES